MKEKLKNDEKFWKELENTTNKTNRELEKDFTEKYPQYAKIVKKRWYKEVITLVGAIIGAIIFVYILLILCPWLAKILLFFSSPFVE